MHYHPTIAHASTMCSIGTWSHFFFQTILQCRIKEYALFFAKNEIKRFDVVKMLNKAISEGNIHEQIVQVVNHLNDDRIRRPWSMTYEKVEQVKGNVTSNHQSTIRENVEKFGILHGVSVILMMFLKNQNFFQQNEISRKICFKIIECSPMLTNW